MTAKPAVAAVDWGTSRLRVWLLDAAGGVLAERRSDEGMTMARPDRFAEILERHLNDMGAPADLPAVVCGMAGARQGWVEAPYAFVPASPCAIFGVAITVPGLSRGVRIVPGLAQRAAETPDVMRGEETQLAGALDTLGAGRHLVCMPGTHSKWVEIADGVVTGFCTFMTGELFDVLSRKSILSHSIGADAPPVTPNAPAFRQGCIDALGGAALSGSLFGIRAGTLLHGRTPEDAAARLSGLLIGAEIFGALGRFGRETKTVALVASGAIQALYEAAFSIAGLGSTAIDADQAVRKGLFSAARHLGLVLGDK